MSLTADNPQPAIHLYLASTSPRRRELLAQIGVCYQVLFIDVAEQRLPDESPEDYVQRLALEKAHAGRALVNTDSGIPVLGADTVVVLDGQVMEKPKDKADALAMLAQLSGQTHEVLSAVALVGVKEKVVLNRSRVSFRATTEQEREAYWNTGEPQDKAGGYAVQGRAAIFISRIEGSFSGVM
ncbi:MAG: Maf family nucleotide pyrophosphatase, partial [Gammaproteobacteria bacterium]|nr:Maf family nucleotide pyrophosphatase [Gammaproteobacteria bacterium]